MDNVDRDKFKIICINCNINQPSGSKKIISDNPFLLSDILLRENLLNGWTIVNNHLNDIDNASIYIDPEIYNLCLKIRKCALGNTIVHLHNHIANTDLEAWSSDLFDLYQLKKELEIKLSELKEAQP